MMQMIVDGSVDGRSVDALVALVTGRSARVRYELRPVVGNGFRDAGKIVFLEDLHVEPYSLERSLDHMKLAGAFGVFALTTDDDLTALVFRRFAATVPFPVFRVDGIGHDFVNDPLPLNTGAPVAGPTRFDGATGTPSYALAVDNVYCSSEMPASAAIADRTRIASLTICDRDMTRSCDSEKGLYLISYYYLKP